MQSKIKTKDSSTIQQVSATYKNNFPADGKIGEQINISPQTHKDEISNKNKYTTLNKDKERQLNPQLAIINQHSNRSLNTSLLALTFQYPLKENKQYNKVAASNEPKHSTEDAIIATDRPENGESLDDGGKTIQM